MTLTHERAEGDHGQQSLDEDAEAVRQSSVVAAVRTRLVDDVRHVGDFQGSPRRQHPAVSVRVHVDGITKGGEIKGAFSPSVFQPAPLSTGTRRLIFTSGDRYLLFFYVLQSLRRLFLHPRMQKQREATV